MVTRISFSHLSKPGLWEAMTTEAWRGDDGLMKRRGKRRASGPPGGRERSEVGFQHRAVAGFAFANVLQRFVNL
ncbi:hypothetical protein B6I57_23720 [Klebsiella quasipneumoniae]|nr:hypothetical protein B6I57_23720 [Klebsiella quasipneumoniae]PLF06352.1 hypothetical protein B6I82_18755 [Klebsiella quasipneumoniae]PLJ30224.1 hypothetical protein B6J62_15985 [Klebsiella quasipneumoniae]HBX7388666.1 hypothetical protein [Klebsiella pneumoniae]